MGKILYGNNLGMVGKWGGASFLFGVTITAFIIVPTASLSRILDSFGIGRGNFPLRTYAYVLDTIPVNQPTELKLDFNQISKANDMTLPVSDFINSALNGLRFNQNPNIGTTTPSSSIKSPSQNMDFSKFFSSSSVSTNDAMSFLKEAAVTVINLTILIISITTQILKGLLGVLKP